MWSTPLWNLSGSTQVWSKTTQLEQRLAELPRNWSKLAPKSQFGRNQREIEIAQRLPKFALSWSKVANNCPKVAQLWSGAAQILSRPAQIWSCPARPWRTRPNRIRSGSKFGRFRPQFGQAQSPGSVDVTLNMVEPNPKLEVPKFCAPACFESLCFAA